MVLKAARFQMSRKENAFNEWMVTTAEQHQRDGLDEEALKVGFKAGFKAGFTRGTLSEMSEQLRSDERGDGHVPRDSGYDKGKRDGHTEASGGKGGSGSGARYDEGITAGYAEARDGGSEKKRGGSGPKVLKKGDAGHGSGKKRRRY